MMGKTRWHTPSASVRSLCLDARTTRNDLASLVLYALPTLPREIMDLPASDVVLRVLIENVRCPDVKREPRE